MKISESTFETALGTGRLFRLELPSGASVTLSSLGAGIVEVRMPDRNGVVSNIALSYADPADYLHDGPCMGKCPGRYANRIAGGILVVDGVTYQLAVNNGPNHLHGGPEVFQNRLWDAHVLEDGVEFSYRSVAGEEHYPGTLDAKVTYRLNDRNELSIEMEARTDADTVVNLTNHTYWNLKGATAGSALDHEMQMKASGWLPTDDTLIPLGSIDPVMDTPMDFTSFKALGRDIKEIFPALKYGKGYDNCWALDGWMPGTLIEDAVVLRDAESGRELHVDTDQPGVQVYTGNWLTGSPLGPDGYEYQDYDGVAIEAQGFPDAPNQPQFPSQLLTPATPYRRTIRYRFTTR